MKENEIIKSQEIHNEFNAPVYNISVGYVDKQINGDYYENHYGESSTPADTQADLSPLQRELMPIFFNDADVVVRFTKEVNGASNPAVAEIINRYIAQEKILKSERKKPLWEILSKYNVYTVGYDNFKARVN